ncbi:metal ABC transporter permease [Erysipelotrichaceae bacterium OH741_COT-311]|nr:metal ABC transporter permease [Erysipelotrichaceae bacterium OH741_COT-311]
MKILLSYDFLVVLAGVLLLAIVSSIVGCFSVYKGQSLVGDAIGHATYPGVCLAFILTQSRNPFFLLIGVFISGILAYFTINLITTNKRITMDAALAIVLSGFFGLGLMLKTYIQGSEILKKVTSAGLKNYVFGLAAFIRKEDVYIILGVSIVILLLLVLFYRQIKMVIFDQDYAFTSGVNTRLVNLVLLVMMVLIITIGLKTIGAILISSFLTLPCLLANQHSKKLSHVLFIASTSSALSTFIGVYLSATNSGLSTGPTIIVVLAFMCLLSMVFGKYGLRGRKHA